MISTPSPFRIERKITNTCRPATKGGAGMSTRAIGSALGISNSTVAEDLDRSESNSRPDKVTSLDGRLRPARVAPEVSAAVRDAPPAPITKGRQVVKIYHLPAPAVGPVRPR
jgi:hypothetical protein